MLREVANAETMPGLKFKIVEGEGKTVIWSTSSRNDFPLKISWCFPRKVFSLVFPGVLIFYAIELGSVSFFKS